MARLSNCGKSETGGLYGEPGDQTKAEYWNLSYWANGWQYVFRYPSASVASLIALYAEHAADNDKIGYSQSGRTTMWQQMSFLSGSHDPAKIQNACNADCSSSTMAIIRAVGLDKNIPALSAANINGTTYSMIGGELESMGFKRIPFGGESMLNTGDILMTDGHACIVISGNKPTESDNDSESDYVIPMPDIADTAPAASDPVQIKYMSTSFPIIKPNMSKIKLEAVAVLQAILNHKGEHLTVDGLYGISTQTKVYQWQKAHNLETDKEVGALTWKSLLTET